MATQQRIQITEGSCWKLVAGGGAKLQVLLMNDCCSLRKPVLKKDTSFSSEEMNTTDRKKDVLIYEQPIVDHKENSAFEEKESSVQPTADDVYPVFSDDGSSYGGSQHSDRSPLLDTNYIETTPREDFTSAPEDLTSALEDLTTALDYPRDMTTNQLGDFGESCDIFGDIPKKEAFDECSWEAVALDGSKSAALAERDSHVQP